MATKSAVIPFHPDLKKAKWLPNVPLNKLTLPIYRIKPKPQQSTANVEIKDIELSTRVGKQPARVYRPVNNPDNLPLLFWIHGGGMVCGSPTSDDAQSIEIVEKLGIAVVNVSYRFAPEHPAPAAINDVEDAYRDIIKRANELKINPENIVIAGGSAGGGLCALLSHRLRALEVPQPTLQVLIYPMLDDRTTLRDFSHKNMRAWHPSHNLWAWRVYLNAEPGSELVQEDFVPSRQKDFSGLPPAWIGVGNLDLFEAEDRDYAKRLSDAGVPCELVIVEGAFHGFDSIMRNAEVSKEFLATWLAAVKINLGI